MRTQNNDVLIKIGADLEQIKKQLGGMGADFNSAADRVKKGVGGITGGFAKFGLAISGVRQGLDLVRATLTTLLKPYADFQEDLAEVNTLINVSQDELRDYGQQILTLTTQINKSARDLTKGLYQVISAGVDSVEEAFLILESSAKAAVGGITETAVAVDAATGVLNAYGLEADYVGSVNDVLFQVVKYGKINFTQLASSIGAVIPFAAGAGVDLMQLGGAIATLTKRNVSAERTMTAIAGVLIELQDPASKASKAVQDLGYSGGREALRLLGLQGTILALSEAGVDFVEIFGREALLAAQNLGSSANDTAADLEAMKNSGGAATDAFNTMNETLNNQWGILKNRLMIELINIGEKIGTWLNPILLEQAGAWDRIKSGIQGAIEIALVAKELFTGLGKMIGGVAAQVVGWLTGDEALVEAAKAGNEAVWWAMIEGVDNHARKAGKKLWEGVSGEFTDKADTEGAETGEQVGKDLADAIIDAVNAAFSQAEIDAAGLAVSIDPFKYAAIDDEKFTALDMLRVKNQETAEAMAAQWEAYSDGLTERLNGIVDMWRDGLIDMVATSIASGQSIEDIWLQMREGMLKATIKFGLQEVHAYAMNKAKMMAIEKGATLATLGEKAKVALASIWQMVVDISQKLWAALGPWAIAAIPSAIAGTIALMKSGANAFNAIMPFAKGGLVEQATVGLVGEAGTELITPMTVLNKVFDERLASLSFLVTRMDTLIDLVQGSQVVVRGTDLVQINNRLSRLEMIGKL